MSWKRSRRGTPMVSTSARWTASPTLRRYASGLPLTSEMRTSGMALLRFGTNKQPDQRGDEHRVNRLGALAARPGLQRLDVSEVVSHGASFQANETEALPSASMTATPRFDRR